MKKFTNYTNKDFTVSWNGKEYTFLPGESGIFEDGIAYTFAKHLADTIFGGTLVAKDTKFIEEMNKAISEVGDTQQDEIVDAILLNVNDIESTKEKDAEDVEDKEDKEEITVEEIQSKKRGRKSKKVEEFEGLKNIDETNL